MILGTGAHSNRRLFDSINEEWNSKISNMANQIKDKNMQISVVNKEKDRITMGIDSAIAKINTRKDGDNKKEGRPGNGRTHNSGMWDMDDDDDY